MRGFWNFSNAELRLENYPNVIIENVHLGDSLMALCYSLALESDAGTNHAENTETTDNGAENA